MNAVVVEPEIDRARDCAFGRAHGRTGSGSSRIDLNSMDLAMNRNFSGTLGGSTVRRPVGTGLVNAMRTKASGMAGVIDVADERVGDGRAGDGAGSPDPWLSTPWLGVATAIMYDEEEEEEVEDDEFGDDDDADGEGDEFEDDESFLEDDDADEFGEEDDGDEGDDEDDEDDDF